MFERIFPRQVDNIYSGNKLALYFFFLITLITIGRSCVHIFSADGGAQSIATIPLDSFTQGGAEAVVYIFAQWGIAQLMVGLIYLLVALRYRRSYPTDVRVYLLGMEFQNGAELSEEYRNHRHRTCRDWTVGFSDLDTADVLPFSKAISAQDTIGLTTLWKYRR